MADFYGHRRLIIVAVIGIVVAFFVGVDGPEKSIVTLTLTGIISTWIGVLLDRWMPPVPMVDESYLPSRSGLVSTASDESRFSDPGALGLFLERYHRAVLAAAPALILWVLDWLGYRNKFDPGADPRALKDIWWHLPLLWIGAWLVLSVADWLGRRRQ